MKIGLYGFIGLLLNVWSTYFLTQVPINDNCFGATSINPSNTCIPVSGTTTNATQSLIGCTGVANDDVWYSFVANQSNLAIQVSGSTGFNPVVEVFSGGCSINSSLACVNNNGNGGTEIANLSNLIIGVTYWIRVYHFAATAPSTPNFTICISPIATIPSCITATPAGNTCSQATLICNVDGYCGSTASTYTADYWPELNTAFCGSIENNSFISFVANSNIVSFNVWVTSSTQNNGIQMMVFSAQNCSGPVNTYACYSPLPPGPNAQLISITGLTAGNTYYLMIDGFAGDICDYVIGVNSGILVSGNISAPQTNICLGNSVVLTASGGDGNYSWGNSSELSALIGSSVVATPTTTGPHSYTMTTSSSNPLCPIISTSGITINVFDLPAPNAGIDDTLCLGSPINLIGQASNPQNMISWNFNTFGISPTPQVTFNPNFSSLNPTVTVNQPGLYSFILRETSNVCGITRDTVKILVIDPSITSVTISPSCAGGLDGQIQINSPFANQFSIDNGLNWQSQPLFTNLLAGSYSICASIPFGCQICTIETIVNPNPLQLTASNDTIICQNGLATIFANGEGNENYSYNWNNNYSLDSVLEITSNVDTTISVFALSESGCFTDTLEVNVLVYPPITATITPNQIVCPNSQTTLNCQASGGNGGPYFFEWSSNSTTQGFLSSLLINPNEPTTYIVQISDACESTPVTLSSEITIYSISPSIESNQYTACEPASFLLTNVTPINQVQSVYWQVDGIGYINSSELLLNSLPAGNYDILFIITTPEGCLDTSLFQNYLTVYPTPVASFTYSPNELYMFNANTFLENTSTKSDQINWYIPMGNPESSTESSFQVSFPDGQTGNYEVNLQVISEQGCKDSISQVIQINSDLLIYAPNAFTPDGDEHNNLWYIHTNGIDIYNFTLRILNRWGKTIWLSNDPNEKWDGMYLGNPVQEGVYSWILTAKIPQDDSIFFYSGHVNVIK